MRLNTLRLLSLCSIVVGISLAQAKCWERPAPPNAVPSDGIDNLVITGYQGWFAAAGDNSPIDNDSNRNNDFRQWQVCREGCSRIIPGVDMWPDMKEYSVTYPLTNPNKQPAKLVNGQTATVFSNYRANPVFVHFRWMREYGIDGAFVGRQTKAISEETPLRAFRASVLRLVARAAVCQGRVFYINYDISEEDNNKAPSNRGGDVFKRIRVDIDRWFSGVPGTFNEYQRERYLKVNGKPVVRIFGIGSKRNQVKDSGGAYIFTATDAVREINELKKKYTVILGVNAGWRDATNTQIREDWTGEFAGRGRRVWRSADIIQPWSIMAFQTKSSGTQYYSQRVKKDIEWDSRLTIAPTIWPGFSWRNKKDGISNSGGPLAYESVARGDGSFYWNNAFQAFDVLRKKNVANKMITVAMFDELNEGTGIMKVETDPRKVPNASAFSKLKNHNNNPTAARFLTGQNVGGPNSERDYFLWLTKMMSEGFKSGSLTSALPQRSR